MLPTNGPINIEKPKEVKYKPIASPRLFIGARAEIRATAFEKYEAAESA